MKTYFNDLSVELETRGSQPSDPQAWTDTIKFVTDNESPACVTSSPSVPQTCDLFVFANDQGLRAYIPFVSQSVNMLADANEIAYVI